MDGVKYMCRLLLSFLRSLSFFFKLVGYVHPLWIGYQDTLGRLALILGARGGWLHSSDRTQLKACRSLFSLIGQDKQNLMNLYCCNESHCTGGVKKGCLMAFSDKNTVDVLFMAPLVVHSFLWLHCFHFVWLFPFYLFVISNWHWQWIPVFGVVVVVVVEGGGERGGWSSSVWPLWPPCQFSGTCLPRWYFSAWEQSTNTSCYNSPASACLSYFVLWADLEGKKQKQLQHESEIFSYTKVYEHNATQRLHTINQYIYCCWNHVGTSQAKGYWGDEEEGKYHNNKNKTTWLVYFIL